MFSLQRDISHLAKSDAFDVSIQELRMNRYSTRDTYQPDVTVYDKRKGPPPRPPKPWKLEDSIWAPRKQWCDSLDFYDTDACERKMFESDWNRCLQCGLAKYIERMDDEEIGRSGEDDGVSEVEEVAKVLWEYHDLVGAFVEPYSALDLAIVLVDKDKISCPTTWHLPLQPTSLPSPNMTNVLARAVAIFRHTLCLTIMQLLGHRRI